MTERNGAQRETGLTAVGPVRWGAHFCVFYETKQDLLEILVPYFEAGLTTNELCLWIVAPFEFLSVTEAKEALTASLPDLPRYLERATRDCSACEIPSTHCCRTRKRRIRPWSPRRCPSTARRASATLPEALR